ncbi:MAG: hypothetical protein LQ341_005532 [Variospora aurantia]|nr:MAG: hypothetical protein LQ341_005532 [Variospora aurantia]
MKSFLISAIVVIASFGFLCGNAAAAPTDAAVKRAEQGLCWIAADGQVHCDPQKREAQPVVPPPEPFINGTSTPCEAWWAVDNASGAPSTCQDALKKGEDITFEQFRELNPNVNAGCTNLKLGYAYCIKAADPSQPPSTDISSGNLSSITSITDPPPLFPALRATQLSASFRSRATCIPVTGIVGPSGTLYDINSAGVTCQTRVVRVDATHSSSPITRTATVAISGRPVTVTYVDDPSILASTTLGPPSTAQFNAALEPNHVNTAPSKTTSSLHKTPPADDPAVTPAEGARVGAPPHNFL